MPPYVLGNPRRAAFSGRDPSRSAAHASSRGEGKDPFRAMPSAASPRAERTDKEIACESCGRISKALHELSEGFAQAIDAKDPFTRNHSDEVAVVAHALALASGLSPAQADITHLAGHLHDIGKIGIPDSLLAKPEPLTDAEWETIREHPRIGASILNPVQAMREMGISRIVLHHHERFDGRGYPSGLAGTDIPLEARIIAVADAFSAMLQRRPYRCARSFPAACREIQACSGAHFDPRMVEAFLSIADKARQHVDQLKDAESYFRTQPTGAFFF